MKSPFIKAFNTAAAGFGYLQGAFSGRVGVYGFPLAAGTELTNFCNLNCPECNSGSGLMSRPRGYMSTDLFEKIIRELGPFLYNLNLYFQGESMLHPNFFEILGKCRDIKTTLSTNGHFLSPENAEKIVASGLGQLIISLDGMNQEVYSLYRVNGDFNKVIGGIKYVSDAKKRIHSKLKVIIQFLVNRNNEHQLSEVREFARKMNVSLHLKSMQVINKDSFDFWIPSNDKFSRYRKGGNTYAIKNRFPDRCARLWFNPVITWDGKVLPCCFDKDAEHVMGDLNNDTFWEIWNAPEYRQFRKNVLTGRMKIEICRNCTSGLN